MKIEKAIEILEAIVLTIDPDRLSDDEDAIKLGIEALKAVEDSRRRWSNRGTLLLSGETV